MSSPTKVTIHSAGTGICALSQREADGFTVTFEDGSAKEQFLSLRAFRQLVGMRVPKLAKPPALAAPSAQNGASATK